jgi:hypothetical protein
MNKNIQFQNVINNSNNSHWIKEQANFHNIKVANLIFQQQEQHQALLSTLDKLTQDGYINSFPNGPIQGYFVDSNDEKRVDQVREYEEEKEEKEEEEEGKNDKKENKPNHHSHHIIPFFSISNSSHPYSSSKNLYNSYEPLISLWKRIEPPQQSPQTSHSHNSLLETPPSLFPLHKISFPTPSIVFFNSEQRDWYNNSLLKLIQPPRQTPSQFMPATLHHHHPNSHNINQQNVNNNNIRNNQFETTPQVKPSFFKSLFG